MPCGTKAVPKVVLINQRLSEFALPSGRRQRQSTLGAFTAAEYQRLQGPRTLFQELRGSGGPFFPAESPGAIMEIRPKTMFLNLLPEMFNCTDCV